MSELVTELQQISKQLTEIQYELNNGFSELLAGQSQINYDTVTAPIEGVTADIQDLFSKVEQFASLSDASRTLSLRQTYLDDINTELMGGAQKQLEDALFNPAPLTNSVLYAASNVARNVRVSGTIMPGKFITSQTQDNYSQVVAYYRALLGQLALLVVENQHANPSTYSSELVSDTIAGFAADDTSIEDTLPERDLGMSLLDPRTSLQWTNYFNSAASRAKRIGSKGSMDQRQKRTDTRDFNPDDNPFDVTLDCWTNTACGPTARQQFRDVIEVAYPNGTQVKYPVKSTTVFALPNGDPGYQLPTDAQVLSLRASVPTGSTASTYIQATSTMLDSGSSSTPTPTSVALFTKNRVAFSWNQALQYDVPGPIPEGTESCFTYSNTILVDTLAYGECYNYSAAVMVLSSGAQRVLFDSGQIPDPPNTLWYHARYSNICTEDFWRDISVDWKCLDYQLGASAALIMVKPATSTLIAQYLPRVAR